MMLTGKKIFLVLWLSESESKHQWMQIFDEIKTRGVEDVLFLSMDGVSGTGGRSKSDFSECNCSTVHRASDPEFHKICAE
ncbi:MAG: transposase [Lacrimispora saccharolytica]